MDGYFHAPARRVWLVIALHLTALAIMLVSEETWVERLAFVLVWIILNSFWMVLLRRAAIAALISLSLVIALVALSRLKHEMIFMTVNFLDVLIIDPDTFTFLLSMFPISERSLSSGGRRDDPACGVGVAQRSAACKPAACGDDWRELLLRIVGTRGVQSRRPVERISGRQLCFQVRPLRR